MELYSSPRVPFEVRANIRKFAIANCQQVDLGQVNFEYLNIKKVDFQTQSDLAQTLPKLATIDSEWQEDIEKILFHDLTIESEVIEVYGFKGIVTGKRREYLRRCHFFPVSHQLDPNSEVDLLLLNGSLFRFCEILRILSTWDLSGMKRDDPYLELTFGVDPRAHGGATVTGGHAWPDTGVSHFQYKVLESQIRSLDDLLPVVNVVNAFVMAPDILPWPGAASLHRCFPNLTDIIAPLWCDWCLPNNSEQWKIVSEFVQLLQTNSPELQTLCLTNQPFASLPASQLSTTPSHDTSQDLAARNFVELLRQATLPLEQVALYYTVHLGLFFDPFFTGRYKSRMTPVYWNWRNLRSFDATFDMDAYQKHDPDWSMQDLHVAVARAVEAMPQIEQLIISALRCTDERPEGRDLDGDVMDYVMDYEMADVHVDAINIGAEDNDSEDNESEDIEPEDKDSEVIIVAFNIGKSPEDENSHVFESVPKSGSGVKGWLMISSRGLDQSAREKISDAWSGSVEGGHGIKLYTEWTDMGLSDEA